MHICLPFDNVCALRRLPSAGLFLSSRRSRPSPRTASPAFAGEALNGAPARTGGRSVVRRARAVLADGCGGGRRRASCTERRFPAGGVTPKGVRHKRGEKTSGVVPVVRAKPDCGFLPNASKHTKARKQAGLRLLLYRVGLCLHIHQAEPYLPPPLGRAGHNYYTTFSSCGRRAPFLRKGRRRVLRHIDVILYRASISRQQVKAGVFWAKR